MRKSKHEKLFDANWQSYIEDALRLYIISESWAVNSKNQSHSDYEKFKKQFRHVIKSETKYP